MMRAVHVVAQREWADGRLAVVSHLTGSSLCTLSMHFASGRRAYVGDFPTPVDALLFANEYIWPPEMYPISSAYESGMGLS